MSNLAKAVLGVQTDAPDLHFDAANPHFKNKFLSLHGLTEALRPVLSKHGLVVLQFPTQVDMQPALRTKLIHAESGETEEDTMLLAAVKLDPQGQGSAITYARRYSLMAILGLVADEDDDGQKATAKPAQKAKPATDAEREPLVSLLVELGDLEPTKDWPVVANKSAKSKFGVDLEQLSRQQVEALTVDIRSYLDEKKKVAA